jgi:hypothetical protein
LHEPNGAIGNAVGATVGTTVGIVVGIIRFVLAETGLNDDGSDVEDQVEFDKISEEEEYEEDIFDQAITESENFTVYSNVEFLLLIGKYCAHSS